MEIGLYGKIPIIYRYLYKIGSKICFSNCKITERIYTLDPLKNDTENHINKQWMYMNILIVIYIMYFVFWRFYIPHEKFSLIWKLHHYLWRAFNFYLNSALKAIEQWGFFSVPDLLCQGTSVYLRGPVTLTTDAKHLAVDLSLPVFTTWIKKY